MNSHSQTAHWCFKYCVAIYLDHSMLPELRPNTCQGQGINEVLKKVLTRLVYAFHTPSFLASAQPNMYACCTCLMGMKCLIFTLTRFCASGTQWSIFFRLGGYSSRLVGRLKILRFLLPWVSTQPSKCQSSTQALIYYYFCCCVCI